MLGQNAQQSRHQAQLHDASDVADIALNSCIDVIDVPIALAVPSGAVQRIGIATGQNGLHQTVANDRGG